MILVNSIEIDVKDESDHIQFGLNEQYVGTTDYEKLRNKPKLMVMKSLEKLKK